jgi:hypothetical protein
MKVFNKIALVLFVFAMLTGCTQRKYGHITGFQLKQKAKTEKVTRSSHYVSNKVVRPNTAKSVELETPISNSDVALLTNIPSVTEEVATSSKLDVNESHNASREFIPTIKGLQRTVAPKNIVKKVKNEVGKKTKAGGLIYWILVLVLILLLLAVLESVLGKGLTRLLILIVLIAFVGHLIGIW